MKIFPNEPSIYYVAPKTEGPPQKISKGKFPDFYRNKLDECCSLGLVKKRKRPDSSSEEELLPSDTCEGINS